MASELPIIAPTRSATPPPEGFDNPVLGLGLDGYLNSPVKSAFDPHSLSPMDENFPVGRYGSAQAYSAQPLNPLSPSDTNSLHSMRSAGSISSPSTISEDGKGAFNFQSVALAKSPITKSSVGQRRGHKYKHSSVSHQIFLEPAPRAPLALPNSLPVPTLKECRKSMSREQNTRFWWSICHMVVAAYTLWSAEGSLALTALSHLILFDALGAMLCVVVDVLGNFEVWKRSSIRHPFGLERAEVLAGFAMSVLLLFMGIDLISHNLEHFLEGMGHESHYSHDHERVSPGEIDTASLLTIISTLISAFALGNHARIGKAMRFAYIESLPSILANPSHFLTISCSMMLLLLPLLSIQVYLWLDRALSCTIAVSMCFLGSRLVKTLGFMLLMSYAGNGVQNVLQDLETDPSVSGIEEAKFWQVHYGLCMANLKLRVRGTEDGLVKLSERVTSLIKNRLGGGYGSGGQRWEVTTQFNLERF